MTPTAWPLWICALIDNDVARDGDGSFTLTGHTPGGNNRLPNFYRAEIHRDNTGTACAALKVNTEAQLSGDDRDGACSGALFSDPIAPPVIRQWASSLQTRGKDMGRPAE
jgi:hypothetical protein